jgi:ABC-2 type transport system ATP-binding protein
VDGRIVVDGLTKRFGPVHAVNALSFSVEPGSVTGFLGPNGAGKSTTLRMVLGLVTPDAGTSTIGGSQYERLANPHRHVGAVLDATSFHPARSGRDHLRVYCRVTGEPMRRADDVLALVGLADAGRRAVRGYSLGMRQRLALATALLGDPPILILDEPANGLDPEGIAWLRRLLRDFTREGGTVLVSSHVLSEMQQLVDHVVIINRGRLVHQGDLASLRADRAVVVEAPEAARLAVALEHAGALVQPTGSDTLRVTGAAPRDIGRLALAHRVELHGLTEERGDLEQIFLSLTDERAA